MLPALQRSAWRYNGSKSVKPVNSRTSQRNNPLRRHQSKFGRLLSAAILVQAIALALGGCAVGQKPGRGQALHVQEPTTGGWYWLYLPEDHILACKQHASARKGGAFVTGRSWPLVVTFHGMKPFDNAASQIREWQQEADRYGFVVIAPQLASPDLLAEFPLQHVHPGVKRDETLTMRAIDDVVRRADVDPNQVLSTSWSSGGYLAHYMANRHPERFSCIAPRQSNFSASVLDPSKVDLYRSNKVGIFYTENDLAICRRESQAAASWYSKHGFDVTFAVFKDLGHQRRPGPAAAFFAQTCGAKAKSPPTELAMMQVKQVPLPHVAAAEAMRNVGSAASGDVAEAGRRESTTTEAASASPRDEGLPKSPAADESRKLVGNKPVSRPSSSRTKPPGRGAQDDDAIQLRVNATIGIAPHLVTYSAIVPSGLRRGSYFLWTCNSEPISNGINGQKYLARPGKYELRVLMIAADSKEYEAKKTITVLEPVRNGRSNSD